MQRYPLENLLRHPVEIYSTIVAFSVAWVLAVGPTAFMLTPSTAYATALVLVVLGLFRLRQGLRIIHYQRSLRQLPKFNLRTDRIPVSQRRLYLGRGYLWEQPHVQRLRDLRQAGMAHFTRPSVLYRWARNRSHVWENRPGLRSLARVLEADSWWNPVRPLPPLGGKPELHAVGLYEREQDVGMDLRERVGHTLVVGTTRVGKTRLAELLIAQDIRRGDVVIVLDPKGDADLMRRVHAESKAADRPCYIMHLGFPDYSARYNAIGSFERITEVAGRIADQLPSAGNSAAFREFSWRFVNICTRALVALGERPDYDKIRRSVFNLDQLFLRYGYHFLEHNGPDDWQEALGYATDNPEILKEGIPQSVRGRDPESIALFKYIIEKNISDSVLEGILSAFRLDRSYYDKLASSLGPLLEKLTSGRTAELIVPDYSDTTDPRPIFDWMSVIRQGAVVYVGLDALSDAVVAGAVGASMFADLTSVAGRLYKHGSHHGLPTADSAGQSARISLHADEFHELVGDQFIPLINKAGGANFQVTAYTQTAADILAGIGDPAKAGQIQGNFNSLIMLRVKSKETAEFLTDQLPRVQVLHKIGISGVVDSSDPKSGQHFVSNSQDRNTTQDVPLLEPADVMMLPKGQAFALIHGGQLYKLRMPLLEDDGSLPDYMSDMVSRMERAYLPATPEGWYRSSDHWWGNAI